MKYTGIFLVIFGVLIINYPEFLSYLIGGFFLFLGLNIVLFNISLNNIKNKGNTDERGTFIKIGKYKIYK